MKTCSTKYATNAVSAQVTLQISIEQIPPGSPARVTFAANFGTGMAKALGVNKTRISITGIYAGSAIVDFTVLPDASGTAIAPAVITSKFSQSGVSIGGFNTAKAIPPTAVKPPAKGLATLPKTDFTKLKRSASGACNAKIVMRPNMQSDPLRYPCPANGLLEHEQFCEVRCQEGWHLAEKKFDAEEKRIKDYPRHPYCVNGDLRFDADCEEDANFTGLFIILGLLFMAGIAYPAVKFWMVRLTT
jgi:hypothetical protein